MQRIAQSERLRLIEKRWSMPVPELFEKWHWQENLKHSEIGKRAELPRATVTRWFRELGIPTQQCTRFTNLNLKRWPPAKQKPKKEFPWKVNQSFFTKWSEEMTYVLGFIVADGAVFTNPRGSQYLAFYSTDREIIEKIRSAMQSNHRIGERAKQENCKPAFVLQIGSKKFVVQLKKFGIVQNKSLIVRMPKRLPEKYLGHFVRGYFDGDGCIYFKKHKIKARKNQKWILSLSFRSGSFRFLQDLKDRLAKHMTGGFITGDRKHCWELVYSHSDSRKLFHLIYDRMKSDLYLTRKYNKYLEAMSWVVGR